MRYMANGADYTRLPIGTKIEDGEIGVCPKCGKRGLARKDVAVKKVYYSHADTFGFFGDEPDARFEFCITDLDLDKAPASN